jgi:hypothetical protein
VTDQAPDEASEQPPELPPEHRHEPPPDQPPEPPTEHLAEPRSPFASLSTEPRSVLGASLDLASRAATDLRSASLYIGLLVLGTAGPFALLLWGSTEVSYFEAASLSDDQSRNLETWLAVTGFLAVVGLVVASIESRGLAAALLGARLQQRPLSVKDGVRRSRMSFWRLVGVTTVVNGPLLIIQAIVGDRLAEAFHGQSELSEVGATLVSAVVGTPFAYVTAGIVLGDVGAIESARRSIRLFSARRRSALVVSIIGVVAQFITLAALLAAVDVLARAFLALGLGPDSGTVGTAVITVVVVAIVFAIGSLTFTVAALAMAPEVVMFTALTHAVPGLDVVRPPGDLPYSGYQWRPSFRWITRPLLATIAMGGVALTLGLATLAR